MQDFDTSLFDNPLWTDSYKYCHYKLYPQNSKYACSYIEARGPVDRHTIFFGLQMYLKRYLSRRLTHDHVDIAKEMITAHGLPFNEQGFRIVVNEFGGRWPLKIKAVKEGTKVRTSNVLVTAQNSDPRFVWLPSFIETGLIQAVWYPTTVATVSYEIKQILREFLLKTSDLTGEALETKLNFMLHDFGFRGVSSFESSAIGGISHLVNFRGTDTTSALVAGRVFYHQPMAAWSVSASEHSVVTTWGKDRELDFYRHQLKTCAKPGSIVSSVIDSYDSDHAVRDLWGKALKDELIASGAILVERPDSGDPKVTVPRLLNITAFAHGFTVNSKGYKVLPNYVRMLQGDHIYRRTIREYCQAIMDAGFSLENMVFGMGGGLLQDCNRDNYKFAMKTSAVFNSHGAWEDYKAEVGEWVDVYKDPVDDPGKRSKRGRLGLYTDADGNDYTGPAEQDGDRLETVWENGNLLRDQTLAEVRELANA